MLIDGSRTGLLRMTATMRVIPYLVDEGPPSATTATYLITITKGVIMISPAARYWNNITTCEHTSNEPIPG